MTGLSLSATRFFRQQFFPFAKYTVANLKAHYTAVPKRGICKSGRSRLDNNLLLVAKASEKSSDVDVRLRGEAEAPFRPVRLVFYGFAVVSASVGLLVAIPQLIASLAGAPNALPREQVLQNVGINIGAAVLFAYLFSQDKKAEARQLSRLSREETLGAQYVELIGGKLVRLRDLRSFVRVVVVAGSADQVRASVEAAGPHREALMARGVMIVAAPVFGGEGSGPAELAEALLAGENAEGEGGRRLVGAAARLDGWQAWFREQAGMANVSTEGGLYVGLRLDGRVRASGRGCPPWAQFAAELAPMEGMWKGLFDGMDGAV
uniref:Uncharacterized protein n=1 Tax=Tetraselmis sp. GSL018 TaxID=582737 RepID=A0A061QXT6_9CHLO|mmetsp:Transcript_12234/g.29038  ORF Transcript_12234/g.29038 Transcript_12234/m.29038 type:complete len:320 (-) Transcript_12234:18-977(-)|eukprot:CAMPEP_0177604110 /NCGR_PEP_ID=MMETSP0419_2-20121207/15927_1 /TAXON_ID=582737 /ORGANISM="Tetraselmis sp., Strain GSL018" /LENGTH=319 /DNA_ID=CAMNT_0019098039 /DNA_START=52 /DNA_END=1011 /DNA_ORIENTATION=+